MVARPWVEPKPIVPQHYLAMAAAHMESIGRSPYEPTPVAPAPADPNTRTDAMSAAQLTAAFKARDA